MLLPVAVAASYPDAQESEKGPRHALLAQFEHVQDGQPFFGKIYVFSTPSS
jgi:hypothetical protein